MLPDFSSQYAYNISIADLPVGTNVISFSRSGTGHRIVYDVDAREKGWSFVLKATASPHARYFLDGDPIQPSPSGIRMHGAKNRVLIIEPSS